MHSCIQRLRKIFLVSIQRWYHSQTAELSGCRLRFDVFQEEKKEGYHLIHSFCRGYRAYQVLSEPVVGIDDKAALSHNWPNLEVSKFDQGTSFR
jgi:hypothetical protein